MPRPDPVKVMTAVRAGAVAGGVVGILLTVAFRTFSTTPLLVIVLCTALGALLMYAYEVSARRG